MKIQPTIVVVVASPGVFATGPASPGHAAVVLVAFVIEVSFHDGTDNQTEKKYSRCEVVIGREVLVTGDDRVC